MTVSTLQITTVKPNDYNPNHMGPDKFAELVEEVRYLGRLPKPIVVKPNGEGYTIVDGEHGWRAAQEVGLETVLAEVIEADDFEARRQTYKRNQHGDHNPVLLGHMFRDMMGQRELSQRALAKEITVSEGTIRNALLYVEAADLRNSYAREKGLDVDGDAQVAALTIRQVRYLAMIQANAPGLAGLWLKMGADVRALLDRGRTLEDVEQEERLVRNRGGDPKMYTSQNVKAWEGSELTGFLKYHNHLNFRSALDQITAWHWFETTWTWGLHDNSFEPEQLRPYTRHYFKGDILAEEVMSGALATIVNTETKPPSFYLTPEAFETVIRDSQHLHETLDEFMERLTAAVLSNGGKEIPLNAVSGKEELIQRAVDADAPDYIRESNLWLTEQKYLLWKLPGDEAAKRVLAQERHIRGNRKNHKATIAEAISKVESELQDEAAQDDRRARYEKFTRAEFAASLADELFGEVYKDESDAMRAVTARLSRLEKLELIALNDFVATEKEIRRWNAEAAAHFERVAETG